MRDEKIGRIIIETGKLFREAVSVDAGKKNINQTYFSVLLFLKEHSDELVKQSDLCKFALVKAPTMSLTLNQMESQGLIVREKSTTDSRVVYVKKTNLGDEMLMDMRKIFKDNDETIINALTSEELDIFYSLIEKIQNAIKERIK